MPPTLRRVRHFDFEPGYSIAGTYEVVRRLGVGWEGEVYQLRESTTTINRAGKFFFPDRNKGRVKSRVNSRKLHRLRNCSVIIPYHLQDEIEYQGHTVVYQVSEYVEGLRLDEFLTGLPNRALSPLQGLHLLYALTKGIEEIHAVGEYHGDIHVENIIVRSFGLTFDVKLFDLHHWGKSSKVTRQEDIIDVLSVFYEALGGKRTYSRLPLPVKKLICGRRRSLIIERYPTAQALRQAIESLVW